MKVIKACIDKQQNSFSVAVVVSTFNQEITEKLRDGALQRLQELGVNAQDITLIEVPGAVEIPFVVQLLAQKKSVKAIIALGAVIRGETTHYDYVCSQVSQGCQQVMLEHNIPVIFGVLTTENEEQALERVGGKHGHKGREAADCALMMSFIKEQLV